MWIRLQIWIEIFLKFKLNFLHQAIKIGATEVVVKDVKNLFVEQFVWPAIKMGLIYEKRYLLGTSLARPCITLALIGIFCVCLQFNLCFEHCFYFAETAKEFNCTYISHGATGKGNDQIRFELSSYALNPAIKVHLFTVNSHHLYNLCFKLRQRLSHHGASQSFVRDSRDETNC